MEGDLVPYEDYLRSLCPSCLLNKGGSRPVPNHYSHTFDPAMVITSARFGYMHFINTFMPTASVLPLLKDTGACKVM